MMARKVMGALVAGALGTSPALADGYESSVVQQLEAEGFRSISTERTWLGRTRITAESGLGQREIVINPNNGEVLRDLWLGERRDGGLVDAGSAAGGSEAAAATSAGGVGGNVGDNGDASADRDDRDRDDDRSRRDGRHRGDDDGRDRDRSDSGRDGGRDGGGDGGGGSGGDNGGGSND